MFDDSDLIVERNEPSLQFMILKQNYSSEKNSCSATFPSTNSRSGGLTTRRIRLSCSPLQHTPFVVALGIISM